MNQEIKNLQAEKRQLEHRLEQCEHWEALLNNRITYFNQAERKKRAHRLITRGAAVESIAPGLKSMSEPDFYELMETVLNHPDILPLLPKAEGTD